MQELWGSNPGQAQEQEWHKGDSLETKNSAVEDQCNVVFCCSADKRYRVTVEELCTGSAALQLSFLSDTCQIIEIICQLQI